MAEGKIEELKKLKELKDAGVLTEEEFTKQKADLLGLNVTNSSADEETSKERTQEELSPKTVTEEEESVHIIRSQGKSNKKEANEIGAKSSTAKERKPVNISGIGHTVKVIIEWVAAFFFGAFTVMTPFISTDNGQPISPLSKILSMLCTALLTYLVCPGFNSIRDKTPYLTKKRKLAFILVLLIWIIVVGNS